MKDKNGRDYAKLSSLKAGDRIELDGGFTCAPAGTKEVLANADGSLYFVCDEGEHNLQGQADNGEDIIGVYPCK